MASHNPLVSIIIPCWNCEATVGQAIESALRQDYPNVEVIVIDDGSTDGSLGIVQSFEPRLRWLTGPNRGAAAARNSGLSLAQGELIQFLDADDLLSERKLAAQIPVMSDDPTEIVYCDRITHRFGCESQSWIDAPSEEGDAVVFALNKIIHTAGPIYRRDVLTDIGGFREDLSCAQDYDLNIRLALAGCRFRRHPEILLIVRRREQSVSSDSIRVLRQMMALWRDLLAELKRRDALTEQRRAAIAARFSGVGRVCVRLGNRAEAEECFDEARSIHPRGTDLAYSRGTRLLRRLVGRKTTEHLVGWKRKLLNDSSRPR